MNNSFCLVALSVLILVGTSGACVNGNQSESKLALQPGGIKTVAGEDISIDHLDEFILKAMDSVGVPGLSIDIINDTDIVYHRAFGVTNSEKKTPVTDKTIFEGASLSKPLFAYFVMKMVEKGTLNLDEPYFPILETVLPGNISEVVDSASLDHYKSITPRMTLSHSTGMQNWAEGKPIHIQFKPGTGFSYSGEAYQHLGAALGTMLGTGWDGRLDSVFQQEVAIPLKMKNSFYVWNDQAGTHKARGHKNGKVTSGIRKYKAFGPAHSLHSEAYDFALFLIEMMDPQNLKKESVDEILKEQNRFKPGNELLKLGQTGWGLGFARRPTPHGIRYMHTGNNHDFQAYCCFYKEKKYGLVFFMNCDKIEPFYDLLGEFLGDKF